jgi:hypothetical protein
VKEAGRVTHEIAGECGARDSAVVPFTNGAHMASRCAAGPPLYFDSTAHVDVPASNTSACLMRVPGRGRCVREVSHSCFQVIVEDLWLEFPVDTSKVSANRSFDQSA